MQVHDLCGVLFDIAIQVMLKVSVEIIVIDYYFY